MLYYGEKVILIYISIFCSIPGSEIKNNLKKKYKSLSNTTDSRDNNSAHVKSPPRSIEVKRGFIPYRAESFMGLNVPCMPVC